MNEYVVDTSSEYKEYDERHGGPWDRGSADSYYERPRNPHYYVDRPFSSALVEEKDMTTEQIEAYYAGYNNNEEYGGKKEW